MIGSLCGFQVQCAQCVQEDKTRSIPEAVFICRASRGERVTGQLSQGVPPCALHLA